MQSKEETLTGRRLAKEQLWKYAIKRYSFQTPRLWDPGNEKRLCKGTLLEQ